MVGIIETGVAISAGGYAVNYITKNYQKRKAARQQQQQQLPSQQAQQVDPLFAASSAQQHPTSSRDVDNDSPRQQQHMPYCNGSCAGACTAHLPPEQRYAHVSYCNGTCGMRCNPEQTSSTTYNPAEWENEKARYPHPPPSY